MTENYKQANRIPGESVDKASVSAWDLPSMSLDGEVIHSAQTEKKKQQSERVEDIPRPAKSTILTADELEKISRDAYDEAFAEGKADGYNKGLEEGQRKAYNDTQHVLNEERKKLSAIAEALFVPMSEQQDVLENTIVDMAVQLTKHILHREITSDPAVLYPVITTALDALPTGAKNIEVHLNKDDAALFKIACPDIQPEWKIVADAHLAPGGCKVLSSESLVDYSLEKRLRDYLADVAVRPDIAETEVEPITSYRKETVPPVPPRAEDSRLPDTDFDSPDINEDSGDEFDEEQFDFLNEKADNNYGSPEDKFEDIGDSPEEKSADWEDPTDPDTDK